MLTSLVPSRFLTLTAHLIITIVILLEREPNVEACLPVDYTDSEYDTKDLQLTIGLSVALALIGIEYIGFLSGTTMFMHTQGLFSVAAHASAAISLAFFIFEQWDCDRYWWIFGFCSCLPAITEIIYSLGVWLYRKRI